MEKNNQFHIFHVPKGTPRSMVQQLCQSPLVTEVAPLRIPMNISDKLCNYFILIKQKHS